MHTYCQCLSRLNAWCACKHKHKNIQPMASDRTSSLPLLFCGASSSEHDGGGLPSSSGGTITLTLNASADGGAAGTPPAPAGPPAFAAALAAAAFCSAALCEAIVMPIAAPIPPSIARIISGISMHMMRCFLLLWGREPPPPAEVCLRLPAALLPAAALEPAAAAAPAAAPAEASAPCLRLGCFVG